MLMTPSYHKEPKAGEQVKSTGDAWPDGAKRLFDILLSAAGLALLAPLMAIIALAVVAESGRPVLFAQTRVGRGFRRFRLYKFRSMRNGARGQPITAAHDGRITRVGRFLRATKLDELPQLWNVLKGDMSLVGPRPEIPEYVERFRESYQRILTVRPGITDLASIRFRHEEQELARRADALAAYEEEILPAKLALAEEYVGRRSLWLDLKILVRTFTAVVGLGVPAHPRPSAAGGAIPSRPLTRSRLRS